MKILMLTPYLPYPLLSGGQIRTYNLLKQLAKKHDVTLFSLIKNKDEMQYIPELEKYCSQVKVFQRSNKPSTIKNIFRTAFSTFPFLVIRNHVPEVIWAIKKELQAEKYDIIHAETFYMMPHIPKTNIPILLVEQTIEYLGYESYAKKAPKFVQPFLKIDIAKIKYWERFYWKRCNTLVTMSGEDKNYINEHLNKPDKIKVVANGVDTVWFAEKRRRVVSTPTILFVGTFKWLPNVEAANYLLDKIWPQLKKRVRNAQLLIVGNEPTQEIIKKTRNDKSIIVTGRIEDIRDAFANAHVLLAPVFSGKGTRYKVLEAMAAGTPIVATDTAVEGLDVSNGEHVMISNEAETMVEQTVQLLKNPALRRKLSENGKKFIKVTYDWRSIAKDLDQIYEEIGIGNVKKN